MTGRLEDAGFGDADPEDAWDPDDPIAELVANLLRRRTRDDRDRRVLELRDRLFDEDLARVLERIRLELEDGA